MANVLLLSTTRDFELFRKANRPYKQLQRFNFRSAITQVANECWTAFNETEAKMMQIQQLMTSATKNFRSTLCLISTEIANPDVVFSLLSSIQHSANQTGTLITNIKGHFDAIQHLLAEIIVVLSDTSDAHEMQSSHKLVSRSLAESITILSEFRKKWSKFQYYYF